MAARLLHSASCRDAVAIAWVLLSACQGGSDASSDEEPTDLPSEGSSGGAGAPPAAGGTAPNGGGSPASIGGAGGNGGASAPMPSGGATNPPSGGAGEVPGLGGAGAGGTAGSAGGVVTAGSPSGGTASGGADAGAVDPCAVPEFVQPTSLSETGLYSDTAAGTLAEGVRPFEPRFHLWSDGADKRRWVYIPPCSQIDSSDPDYWQYPEGFKLWKEFSRENADGELVRVETRLIQKYTATKWFMTAFVWNDDQTDAAVVEEDAPDVPIALENAKGTDHDVPGQKACDTCHFNQLDKALGFSALQLDRDDAPDGFVTLETLETEGLLSDAIARPITLPGTPEQAAALGYMHANCGHCHNPWSKQAGLSLQFWLELGTLGAMESTHTYVTTLGMMNQAPQTPEGQPPVRVVAGSLDESAVHWRMIQPPEYPGLPEGGVHMPLIATSITDEAGVQLVADWINSLAAP